MANPSGPLPQLEAYAESLKSSYYLQVGGQNTFYVGAEHHLFSKSKPQFVIHSGPNDSDPPLAYITKESKLSENTIIHVPTANGEVTTLFKTNCFSGGGMKTIIHRFSLEVGSTRRTEDFEWRMVTSGPVKEYGSYGFELRHLGTGGDGQVVALLGLGKKSLHTKYTFLLVGEGASGIFGKEWELVALATAVRTDKVELDRLAINGVV